MSHLFTIFLLGAFLPRDAFADKLDCTKFGEYAKYNDTIGKCVLPYSIECDEAWSSDEYVCGWREEGQCLRGSCECPNDLQPWFHDKGDPTEAGNGFSCISPVGYGESGLGDRGIYGTSQKFLSCSEGTCICDDHWNETDRTCKGDEFCNLELGTTASWDAFYESSTGLCKCKIGSKRCVKSGGDESAGLCPVNATIKQSDLGWTCECNEGLAVYVHPSDGLGDDNAPQEPICGPRGKPGQPCSGWSQGTCLPGLICPEQGDRACTCEGEWDEVPGVCYSQANCEELKPRFSYMQLRIFHRNGSRECTCFLGVSCPWLTKDGDTSTMQVGCPVRATPQPSPWAAWAGAESCACVEGLVGADGGRACVPMPHYGESCDRTLNDALSCANASICTYSGKCECEAGAPWDPVLGRCLRRLGDSCSVTSGDVCIPKSECAHGRCECVPGFSKDTRAGHGGESQFCRLQGELDAPCNSNAGCKSFTRCKLRQHAQKSWIYEERCTCQGKWNAADSLCRNDKYCQSFFQNGTYESESGLCKCPVGSQCTGQKLGPDNCPDGAVVVETGDACACGAGMMANDNGKECAPIKQHGEECSSADQCVGGSVCLGWVCQCQARSHVWIAEIGQCMVKVKSEFLGCGYDGNQCVPNAECVIGQCKCPAGYQVAESGECLAEYGTRCQRGPYRKCAHNLKCVHGRCGCRDLIGQSWKAEAKECVTLVGAKCDSNEICVKGSTCNLGKGTCQCDADSAPAQNRGRCIKPLKFGANCKDEDCDPNLGLVCVDGECACADSSLAFDSEVGACVGQLDSECGDFEIEGSCVGPVNVKATRCEYRKIACGASAICRVSVNGAGVKLCQAIPQEEGGNSAPTMNYRPIEEPASWALNFWNKFH